MKKGKKGVKAKDLFAEWGRAFQRSHEAWVRRMKRKYGASPPTPEEFWKERKGRKWPHICDFTIEELRKRHAKELAEVCDRESAGRVGTLIMGDGYLDGFSSRSCSQRMSDLVNQGTDYLDFYCAGSTYYTLKAEQLLKRKVKKER